MSNPIVNQQSTQVTQHRASVFLTSDLAIEFTVFDHHNSQVPQEAWDGFVTGYRHAHGTDPASSLRQYVTERSVWQWDTTYSDGAVVIGDPDGPLVLEDEQVGPEGCRIVFWHEGDPYDTGLRVWGEEAGIITWLLRDKKTREDDRWLTRIMARSLTATVSGGATRKTSGFTTPTKARCPAEPGSSPTSSRTVTAVPMSGGSTASMA